ncbi:MAG: dipeptidase [Clostridia bacterium]|nr:dipeptidase [Clostridia bacterium]
MAKYPFGLCDLHCDTLYELPKDNTDFHNTNHHISFDRVGDFTSYTQVMALWSNVRRTDDECYEAFWNNYHYGCKALENHPEIMLCKSGADLKAARADGKQAIVLGVEGGNLLGEDLSRLDSLYEAGVRIFTLVWGSVSRMGGAHDVGGGLSPFGVQALKKIISLGIIPDVSHASREIFYQTAAYCDDAGVPFIATHSNSAAVHPHTRCLDDEQFTMIKRSGGLVGISMCMLHLTTEEHCTVGRVVEHIERYLSLGGEKTVCFGCDFDGIGTMPDGMTGVESMGLIAEEMLRRNYKESLIADIFQHNAENFLINHI